MGLPKFPNCIFSLCGKGFCLGKSLDLGSSTSQMMKTQMQQGKLSVGFWKVKIRKMLKNGDTSISYFRFWEVADFP